MKLMLHSQGLSEFRRACLQTSTRVVSVDVFDTLLLRTTKPESARFFDIGRQHHMKLGGGADLRLRAEDWLYLRLMAARAAYRNTSQVNGVREPAYEKIAHIMLTAVGAEPSMANMQAMLALELEYEKSVLAPNKSLLHVLLEAKRAGKRVICISDMYFRSPQITALIHHHGVHCVDRVYSSADYGFNKHSGKLFAQVLKEEGVAAEEMVHSGDNATSDYLRPTESGVRAFYMPRSRSWRLLARGRRRLFAWRHALGAL